MEQFEVLKEYLAKLTLVPPTQWLNIIKHLRLRRLEKDELYYAQGEMFDEIGFIAKGLIYNFYTDAAGEEFVTDFRREGQPVTCYSDLLQKKPASYSSKALEPVILITLKYKDFKALYDEHPCWDRIGRLSAEQLFIEKEQKEKQFLMLDAKLRYENFMKNNSELANRIPQYLIASYIGVSPVSLSRIRSSN